VLMCIGADPLREQIKSALKTQTETSP
jgi:hypothetical protein